MNRLLLIVDGLTGEAGLDFPFGLEKYAAERGYLITCPPGRAPESLACIATLLGVPEELIPRGRAYLEALALGLPVAEDEVVYRGNLAVASQGRLLAASCGHWPQTLQQQMTAIVQRQLAGRAVVWPLGGAKLLMKWPAAAWAENLPPHQHVGRPLAALWPSDAALSRLMKQSMTWLADCAWGQERAILWPWSPARRCQWPSFAQLWGIQAALVAKTEIVVGLGKALGLAVASPVGATGDVDTDLLGKCRLARELARTYPLVILHVNGADEAAHRQDCAGKRQFLKRLAEAMQTVSLADGQLQWLVCADHGTRCADGAHQGGPQPYWRFGGGPRGDVGLRLGSAVETLWEGCDNG